jgi:chromosome transmission fidelity protein 8
MIITLNISLPTSAEHDAARSKLPPHLARLGDSNSDELVLIELQGALEVEGPKDGQLVGKLKFDDSVSDLPVPSHVPLTRSLTQTQGKPSLMIGHNLLEGKISALPKPLAVLERSNNLTAKGMATGDSMVADGQHHAKINPAPSWDIIAIVKRKIVFAKRPMPIVGLSASSKLEGTLSM